VGKNFVHAGFNVIFGLGLVEAKRIREDRAERQYGSYPTKCQMQHAAKAEMMEPIAMIMAAASHQLHGLPDLPS
jgi:hypothetical protein